MPSPEPLPAKPCPKVVLQQRALPAHRGVSSGVSASLLGPEELESGELALILNAPPLPGSSSVNGVLGTQWRRKEAAQHGRVNR